MQVCRDWDRDRERDSNGDRYRNEGDFSHSTCTK